MNDQQFDEILEKIKKHLQTEKVFIQNPFRAREMVRAMEIIHELFPEDEVHVKDDPLQTGAMIISVEMPYMVVRGQRELQLFNELNTLINNFEVISEMGKESVQFSVVIQEVNVRIS